MPEEAGTAKSAVGCACFLIVPQDRGHWHMLPARLLIDQDTAVDDGDVFGRIMMHSPAFNLWVDRLEDSLRSADFQSLCLCYMDVGTNDFTRMTTKEEMLRSADWMREQMLSHGLAADRLRFFVIPGGQHSLATWRWTFPDALRWTFRDC